MLKFEKKSVAKRLTGLVCVLRRIMPKYYIKAGHSYILTNAHFFDIDNNTGYVTHLWLYVTSRGTQKVLKVKVKVSQQDVIVENRASRRTDLLNINFSATEG